MNFSIILGRRVRELRKVAGFSQDQAAERAGISGKYLGQIERGEVNVSAAILNKLALVFGVNIVEFYDNSHLESISYVKSDLVNIINSESDDNIRVIHKVIKAILR